MKKIRGCYPRSSGVRKILLTMRFLALFLFCTGAAYFDTWQWFNLSNT